MKLLLLSSTLWLLVLGLSSCKESDNISDPYFNHLKNVQWRLIAFDTLVGKTINLSSTDTILLFLEETNVTSGKSHGECANRYSGVYTFAGGNHIRFDILRSTEAVCPNSRYWDFIDKLETVTSFSVSDSLLYLYYNANKQKLLLTKTL